MNTIWESVQKKLVARIGAASVETWLSPMALSAMGADRVYLQCPNPHYADWVECNYMDALRESFAEVLGRAVQVRFEIETPRPAPPIEPPIEEVVEPVEESEDPSPRLSGGSPGISPTKTFHNFVVGASNQFAQAAAQAVAEEPGHNQYNPLFIYGSTGLGKTHLMHAIGNAVLRRDRGARILYVTAEKFTNELIEALRFKQMAEFRERYRNAPTLLLMDDVQFLTGKERTQEELFHTFEYLRERGRQIVFTADVLPKEIKGLEPRLRTRCESGMLADMQPPDMETLLAIIQQKASDADLPLEQGLCDYIGARVRGNIREVEGVLNRLGALCRIHHHHPTLEFARQHLGSVLSDNTQAPTAEDIIRAVAEVYNIKVQDLKGDRRHKQLVRPRHVAMWMVRKNTDLSFPEIGRVFERDHATVQHAVKKIEEEHDRDIDLRNAIHTIKRNCRL